MQLSRNALIAGLVSAGLALAAAPAAARDDTTGNEALIGAGAAVATLFYGPAKLVYAAGGGLVGGLAWLWSGGDDEVVRPILNSSLRGDYVVTPDHLRGQRNLEFVGRTVAQRAAQREIDTGVGAPANDSIYGESF